PKIAAQSGYSLRFLFVSLLDFLLVVPAIERKLRKVKFQQGYQMRHRKSRDEDARWGFNSGISSFLVRWLHPSPPRLLSARAIALNHLDESVRKNRGPWRTQAAAQQRQILSL